MAFRTLLLCVLVSYVAVIAASPIESEKVEVENVESSTQDSSLADLEDISIEGEVIDPDSEEHPESAGLFGVGKKITKGFEKMSSGVSSMKNKWIKKANKVKRPGKKPNANSLHTVSHKPNKDRNRKNPRTSNRRDNARASSSRDSNKPNGDRSRKIPKPSNRRDNARASSSRDSNKPRKPVRQTKPAKKDEPSFGKQLKQEIISSATSSFVQGATSSLVDHGGNALGNLMNQVKANEPQYYDHPEDDDNGDDDDSEDTADDEEDGDECKQDALDYCFGEDKSSDPKKCMEDYKC